MCATCGCMGNKKAKKAPAKKAAKKSLSPKQKKIANIAGDKSKIDASDLAALRAKKKK